MLYKSILNIKKRIKVFLDSSFIYIILKITIKYSN